MFAVKIAIHVKWIEFNWIQLSYKMHTLNLYLNHFNNFNNVSAEHTWRYE